MEFSAYGCIGIPEYCFRHQPINAFNQIPFIIQKILRLTLPYLIIANNYRTVMCKLIKLNSCFSYKAHESPWSICIPHWPPEINSIVLIPDLSCEGSLVILAFLNCSRLHEKLSKNVTANLCWVYCMVPGRIFWIMIGNKYQSNWPTVSSISSNPLLNLWPSSHALNTRTYAQPPHKRDSNNITVLLSLFDYMMWIKTRNKWSEIEEWSLDS